MLSFLPHSAEKILQNGVFMASPADFDVELNTLPWAEVYARYAADPARRALAALASQDAQIIRDSLPDPTSQPLTHGARLMCLAQLGEYDQVRQEFRVDVGADLDTLEGTMLQLIARSVAESELRTADSALPLLHSAGVLAGLLGTVHRRQSINLEEERMRLPFGTASAKRVREALALAPAKAARVAYAQQIEGAALLACGRYLEAGRVARGGVEALVLAMQGGFRLTAHPDRSFGALALGAQALIVGEDPAELVRPVLNEPEATYGWLLQAAYALTQGHLPPLHEMPAPADQRVLWGLASWEALLRGDVRQSPEAIITALRTGLPALESVEPLLVAAGYTPVALAALGQSPLASLISGLPEMPVILGEHLLLGETLHKLPGRTGGGVSLLMQALGVEWKVSRVERQRLRKALDELQLQRQPVLVTDVAKGLAVLVAGGGQSWRAALLAVTNRVGSKVVQRKLIDLHGLSGDAHA